MRRPTAFLLAICSVAAFAGQPIDRFRSADTFTFSQGSADTRYGNADCDVKVTMNVFLLGNQVFDNPGNTPETALSKSPGTLDFTLKLSDFDPLLPPDTVTMTGSDQGNDLMSQTCDQILPGPYTIQGTYQGIQVNLTLTNVHVTGTMLSQGSNNVTEPEVNPVLGRLCDVQFDDPVGSNNSFVAIPQQVSGWIISPTFTVKSLRVDITGVHQACQVPAHVVAPDSFSALLGRVETGNTTSLADTDGDVLRVCKFIVPNQNAAPVTVEVFGTLPDLPQYISLYTNSRMTVSGVFQQILDLYDFAGSGYATGDTRSDTITTTLTSRKLDATGAVDRYLGTGNTVRARYRIRQTGPAANSVWCAEHDQVGWIVTP